MLGKKITINELYDLIENFLIEIKEKFENSSSISSRASREHEILSNDMLENFHKIDTKFEELLESLKAFTELECMTDESSINVLQVILDKIDKVNKKIDNQKDTIIDSKKIKNNIEIDEDKYSLCCSLNQSDFFNMLDFLKNNKKSGEGKLFLDSFTLNMDWVDGNLFSYKMESKERNEELEEISKKLEINRLNSWEAESEENLVNILVSLMQTRTQYLSGIVRVLSKMSKKQIIDKLRLNARPFLKRQENFYSGEALFYYSLKKWKNEGQKFLKFTFSQKSYDLKKVDMSVSVSTLKRKFEKFMGENFDSKEQLFK